MRSTVREKEELIFCEDREDLADKAARVLVQIITQRLAETDKFTLALSGGSTPKLLYARMLQEDMRSAVDWSRLLYFVSDERTVPIDSPESNYGNALRLLFQVLELPQESLQPLRNQELDADAAALDYEERIRKLVAKGENGIPSFDLILLGMGSDGHTASLFPDTKALQEKKRLVLRNHVPKLNSNRITFTYPLLNNARNVIYLVSGKDKAQTVKEVFTSESNYPCARVMPEKGRLIWFIDREAASELEK